MNKANFDEIYQILEDSFPIEEFRNYESQKQLLARADYDILTHQQDDELIGICAYYNLDNCLYVEHLACTKEARGKGIGTILMGDIKKMADQLNKMVILEVEPPTDAVTKRRIHFYEKLGLKLDPRYHFQPSLNKDTAGVELKIMSTNHDLSQDTHNKIRHELNEKVYGVDKYAHFE